MTAEESLSFAVICGLLSDLERLLTRRHDRKLKLTRGAFYARQKQIVARWIEDHRRAILRDKESLESCLSLLFPEFRRERVYTLKEHTLSGALAAAMGRGKEGAERFRQWRLKEKDLGITLEQIMTSRVRKISSWLTPGNWDD